MASQGNIPTMNGRGMVRKNGSLSVVNANGKCPNCCCKPKILVSHTIAGNGTWDLTPYQGDNQALSGSSWRLRESGHGVVYASGEVNKNGKLVGLPNSFKSSYSYAGYMRIEIGCPQKNGSIKWP
jgi:hypothetical protein